MASANCTSGSSSNETIVSNPVVTMPATILLVLSFLVGFPGNAFVVWSILASRRKSSITTLLILNLAIADGSLMTLTPFFIVYLAMMNWVIGVAMCKILYYLSCVNMYASIYLIMLMSVYRLVSVMWPVHFKALTDRKPVRRVLAAMWLLIMVASIPPLIFRDVKCRAGRLVCESFHDHDSEVVLQYTMECVIGFFVPYAIILVSYICVLRRLKQTQFRRRVTSEKLILAIVVTFGLFWLPYQGINIVQISWALCPAGRTKQILGAIWLKGRAIVSTFGFISGCANPVLYVFVGKSYIRKEGLMFMVHLFERTSMSESFKRSKQNYLNSRGLDRDLETQSNDKDQDSATNLNGAAKSEQNEN